MTTSPVEHSSLRRAMSWIETHLDGDLSLQAIATAAYISPFHFHRMFTMAFGIPVAEYVRTVRMEEAAYRLRSGTTSIADLARRVGYESPDAFGRAFRNRFFESPSVFRKRWRNVPPPLRVAPHLTPAANGNHGVTLRHIEHRQLACVRHIGAYHTVWQAWKILDAWASDHRTDPHALERIGISWDDPEMVPANRIRYDACISILDSSFKDRASESSSTIAWREIDAGEFATVIHRGPYHLLGEAYRRLYVGWLASSERVPRDDPSIEVYLDVGAQGENELVTEIQLPLRPPR